MAEKRRRSAVTILNAGLLSAAAVFAGAGCARDVWSYRAVPDVNIARPTQQDSEGVVVLETEPDEPPSSKVPTAVERWLRQTQPTVASRRTVLMVSWKHETFYDDDSGGRTLLVFLTGAPKVGRVWLDPDNSVLLTYSGYSAPAHERVNLVGSINVKKVLGDRLVADVTCGDVSAPDSTAFLERPWDPTSRMWPFRLGGTYTFAYTTPADPLFKKSAVQWVHSDRPWDAGTYAVMPPQK